LTDISRYPRFLTDASRYLILIKFGGIVKSVKFNGFLRYRVDINRNLRLMDLSGFLKFQFRIRAVYYRTFLLAIGGGK
jgi:hypothetical protein